jgi:hypothetical protein
VKTEAALTCETLEETYYPLRRKYPEVITWDWLHLGTFVVATQAAAIESFH